MRNTHELAALEAANEVIGRFDGIPAEALMCGVAEAGDTCPLARTIRHGLPEGSAVLVGATLVEVCLDGEQSLFDLPGDAREFVRRFDRGLHPSLERPKRRHREGTP